MHLERNECCEICGGPIAKERPWNEGACDLCRTLIQATPEDRARYLAMMAAATEQARGARDPAEAFIEALVGMRRATAEEAERHDG